MKPLQQVFAFAILCLLIAGLTFVVSYLGSRPQTHSANPGTTASALELSFAELIYPPPTDGSTPLIRELYATGHYDFWFHNANTEPVEFGLLDPRCSCTGVEGFILPADRHPLLTLSAVSLAGLAPSSPLLATVLYEKMINQVQHEVQGTELLKKMGSVKVPPGAVGWARLRYEGKRQGGQVLNPTLWMNDRELGRRISLAFGLQILEPLRTKEELRFGTLRQEELEKTVTRHIVCWSSTRLHLPVEGKLTYSAGPMSEPVEVGTPQPLSAPELLTLSQEVREPICVAYRIPVTLLPISRDGKRPFDLGPFRRWISISSPSLTEEKTIMVVGYLRGLVEIAGDEEGTAVNFRVFKQSRGKTEKLYLTSNEPGVKLEFDRERTPAFLRAVVTETKGSDNRQGWEVRVEVLPGKASGTFPRKEDPEYQDSAVYFKASQEGKPARSIRVSVVGIASAE